MNIFKRTPSQDEVEELKRRVDDAEAIQAMTQTAGWQVLTKLLDEQLDAYKADMLLQCKSWDDYQEKRGKAFGIQLLRVDVEDFIRQGEDAALQLDKLNH